MTIYLNFFNFFAYNNYAHGYTTWPTALFLALIKIPNNKV